MHHAAAMRLLQAVADVGCVAQDLLDRQRPLGQAVGQRLAFQILHDQVVGAVLVSDVVERADVGMIQRRDGPRFAVEALLGLRVFDRWEGRILIATVRSRRVSRARYTSPMPPAPSGDRIS